MSVSRSRARRPALESLDGRVLLSGLSPQQVSHAYGLDAIRFNVNGQSVKGNGSGQTIAIVDAFHDPYLASDLHRFDQAYGLADPTLTVVNQAGRWTDDGWAGEEALDVELAHAIAPGANIVVVEAWSDSIDDLMAAVDTARRMPGVSTVSMSWGGPEFRGQTSYDTYFTTPTGHNGVTFLSASGDEGSWGGAEWPSSSARVLSVGGTSLRINTAGNYLSESVWSGTSGGYSRFVSEPSFQRALQVSGRRSTPDVAFNANPNTGVSVYSTDPSTGWGSWYTVGGTSLGAPAWAAIVAIADQGRALAGKGTLDGATQTLPALYASPSGAFHKVGGVTTTGLGTPNGAAVVNDLVSTFGPLTRQAVRPSTVSKSSLKPVVTAKETSVPLVLTPWTPETMAIRWDRKGRAV
jgi:subtilase family serine protease